MSDRPIFNALYAAIIVRQAERASVGDPPLEEMTISREAFERFKEEAKGLCTVRDSSIRETRLMGVLIRRLGDG